MAISSSALTLGQYAIMSNDPLVQAITFSLLNSGTVLSDIPFANKRTLVANGVRWEGSLPSVSWVNLNEEGTTVSGTPTAFQEQAYILRNYIDVDKYLVLDENRIIDPRAGQAAAYLRSVAYDFNDKFINNNHVSGDNKSIVGLRNRIDNGTTFGVASANKIDAGAVDLTSAGMTAATFASFTEFVDQLLWSVDSPSGEGVVLYLNEVMKRRWERALRQFAGQGGFAQATDQNGRTVDMYKGALLRDVGYKSDQSTRIITATETANGATLTGSTHTSIYACHYDMEHLFGWQFEPLMAKDQGLMENGAIYRTLIDWAGGLYNANLRSMGRVHGIKLS